MQDFFSSKSQRLWLILSGIFIASALVAEFMGVKLFSLEKTLGFEEANLTLWGQQGLSFTLTAGVLLWPAVFILTDILNEYYGMRGVKFLSWLTAALVACSFLMLFLAMQLEPADFWRTSHIKPDWDEAQKALMLQKVSDYNVAYSLVFGQSLWIIVGSLIAFLVGQIVDVKVFHSIKMKTGENKIWLRSTGSTLVSQFIDSFIVVFIALYIGQKIPFAHSMSICMLGYLYKFIVAILMTPVIYLVHTVIEKYLGHELASKMKMEAANEIGNR